MASATTIQGPLSAERTGSPADPLSGTALNGTVVQDTPPSSPHRSDMSRPGVRCSPGTASSTALIVTDAEGLDALSLERLAYELGERRLALLPLPRRGEFLAAVARACSPRRRSHRTRDLDEPQDDHPWIEWFVEVTCAVRG
jgi:hypothetical protein